MSLPDSADTKRYVVAGRRARNSRRRTLLVRAALLCPTLVRLFLLSLRRGGMRMLDSGPSILFEPR